MGCVSAEQGPGELTTGVEQFTEGGVYVRVRYRQRPACGIAAVPRGAGSWPMTSWAAYMAARRSSSFRKSAVTPSVWAMTVG
jgi:hypothetical protein